MNLSGDINAKGLLFNYIRRVPFMALAFSHQPLDFRIGNRQIQLACSNRLTAGAVDGFGKQRVKIIEFA
jgi:hypothetical protein